MLESGAQGTLVPLRPSSPNDLIGDLEGFGAAGREPLGATGRKPRGVFKHVLIPAGFHGKTPCGNL